MKIEYLNNEEGVTIKIKAWVSGIIILAAGIGIIYFFYGWPWELIHKKQQFETYMENEYQKDFVVSHMHYDFFHDTYAGTAYAKSDPEMTAYVGERMRTKQLDDAYGFNVLQNKAESEIRALMKKELPDCKKVGVDLISLQDRELEINVASVQPDDKKIEEIRSKIEQKGYIADQLYFYEK